MRHLIPFVSHLGMGPDTVPSGDRDCVREPSLESSDICHIGEFYTRSGNTGLVAAVGGQVVFDAASCGAAAVTIQTVTIADADLGDVVIFVPPAAGLSVAVAAMPGYVSAAGTVKVPFVNPTAGALDPASVTFDYYLLKKPSNLV